MRSADRPRWQRGLLAFLRNRTALVGAAGILAIGLLVTLGPAFVAFNPEAIDLGQRLAPSSPAHPLGTDSSGRDILSRLLYGGRVSLAVGFVAALLAGAIGTIVGAAAGYRGSVVDAVLMRFTDAVMSMPALFLSLAILAVFGSGPLNVTVVIAVLSWMVVARLIRAEVLRTLNLDYITAARVVGADPWRVLRLHLLPQAIPTLTVAVTLAVGRAIIVESSLSYLGIGISPPTPTWGNMLAGAQNYIFTAPQFAIYPGLLITIFVLCTNWVGDGLRDALDPRLQTL